MDDFVVKIIGVVLTAVVTVVGYLLTRRSESQKTISTSYNSLVTQLRTSYEGALKEARESRCETEKYRNEVQQLRDEVRGLSSSVDDMRKDLSSAHDQLMTVSSKYKSSIEFLKTIREWLQKEFHVELPDVPDLLKTDLDR